jgi:histidine triad (HIT) family protein
VSDCIFCKMVSGDIAAEKVYEDEYVIAVDDISPQAPVHTLVIPRKHVVNLSDDVPGEVLTAVFSAAAKVASVRGVAETGYRVIVNNGPDANQTVQHLHVHVMGGREMAHGMVNFSEG